MEEKPETPRFDTEDHQDLMQRVAGFVGLFMMLAGEQNEQTIRRICYEVMEPTEANPLDTAGWRTATKRAAEMALEVLKATEKPEPKKEPEPPPSEMQCGACGAPVRIVYPMTTCPKCRHRMRTGPDPRGLTT